MKTKDVLVVLLAGGEGKRFYPFITDKSLFPYMGRPMVDWVLQQIEKAGFENLLVATNSKNNEHINNSQRKLNIKTKKQPKPLGQADALKQVLKDEIDRPILVMNAVDLVESDLLQKLVKSEKAAMLTGKRMDDYFPGGYLETKDDRVISIVEKPEPDKRPSNLVNLVEHFFASSKMLSKYLDQVPLGTDDEYELALDMMIKEQQVGFVEYQGFWQKLKYPHFVLPMMDLLMEQMMEARVSPDADISDKAEIVGKVRIESGAKIFAGASVVGPAYIGKNTVVGQHTLIRESMIEAGSVIGFGSEIARSYIGEHCELHHNFVGDSVLEGEINPSWGTTFANLRLFDKRTVGLKLPAEVVDTAREKLGAMVAKGVKMGVNCSVMPGVTIAAGSTITPGSVVTKAVIGG
jgi:bifunctional UDP-N-acetylglucosamine pyrophosphorylase/glucosamine-1-phosphate N-acetyltransferase